MEHHPAVLQCITDGEPIPTIIWKKEDDIVREEIGILEFELGKQKLTVVKSRTSNEGLYTCMAINVVGTQIAQIRLIVMSEYNIMSFFPRRNTLFLLRETNYCWSEQSGKNCFDWQPSFLGL